jgi:hypothetical protein
VWNIMAQHNEDPLVNIATTSSLAEDSGIDAGDAHDQDNHGNHVLHAQFESDEASTDTDEG